MRPMTSQDMRPKDQHAFSKAAMRFQAWIFVRLSNPLSRPYMARRPYEPKPIDCKPKTANRKLAVGRTRVAGLVTDPVRWPAAFSSDKLNAAVDEWMKFRKRYGLGGYTASGAFEGVHHVSSGYATNTVADSLHEGCLTLEGSYLYSDYDLFHSKLDSTMAGQNVPAVLTPVGGRGERQESDFRDPRWLELSSFLNGQLGITLIQHGAQLSLKPGEYGSDEILLFGPRIKPDDSTGRREVWTGDEVRKWDQLGVLPIPT